MRDEFLETIKIVDGKALHMPYHQQRYERTLKLHGMSSCEDLASWIKPPKEGLYRCRLLYILKDPQAIEVSYHPYTKRQVKKLQIMTHDTLDYRCKYSDRDTLDVLFAKKKEEADDILIVKNNLLTDTTIANIALLIDGDWVTPKYPLLAGTTRQRYLDASKIIEKDILVNELAKVEKVALMNAMIDFDIVENCEFLL
jgi:4-amino-4-deoxychorismate lyase